MLRTLQNIGAYQNRLGLGFFNNRSRFIGLGNSHFGRVKQFNQSQRHYSLSSRPTRHDYLDVEDRPTFITISKGNFQSALDDLKEKQSHYVLEFRFALSEDELHKVLQVIKGNPNLSQIKWHREQRMQEKIWTELGIN